VKKRLKIVLVVLLMALALFVATIAGFVWWHNHTDTRSGYCLDDPISPGFCNITLDPVTTPDEQAEGLSGRDSLSKDNGMIFEFTDSEVHCFWMKDMRFSIDMLWLDEKGTILAKEINVSPSTYPTNFCPEVGARSVVELNANVAKDWPVGSTLSISAPAGN
jgi:uncharacterized membrane protein (UPF0127 family)